MSKVDSFSRILIITASFFSIAALTLSIVGLATRSWYVGSTTNGSILYYNLFTQCLEQVNNSSTNCMDIDRSNSFGLRTQHAAAFLVVAVCLLGCGTLVILAMNIVSLTPTLLFVPPILLFLAALFMVATFAEASRVSMFNGYSAILVQTGHVLTIFSMGIITFTSGRLHHYYNQLF